MAAHIDHQNGMGIGLCQNLQVLPLDVRKIIIAFFQLAVISLACLPHQHIDGGIRSAFFDIRLGYRTAAGITVYKTVRQRDDLHRIGQTLDLFFHHIVVGLIGGSILGIVVIQPVLGSDLIACVFQAVLNVDAVALLHAAAAQAALYRHPRAHAVEGDFFILQGQSASFILQQNKALGSGFSRQRPVPKLQLRRLRRQCTIQLIHSQLLLFRLNSRRPASGFGA